MSRLARALALVPPLLAFGQGLAFAEEGKSAAPKPDTNSEAKVDGTAVSEMSDIEDASLEGLMNLDLEDLVLPLSGWLSVQFGGQGSLERVEAPFVHPVVSGEARSSYGFYSGLKADLLHSLDLIATVRGDLSPISASLEYSYRASAIYRALRRPLPVRARPRRAR